MKPRLHLRSRLAVGLVAGALLISGCASSSDSDDKKSENKKAAENSSLVSGMVNTDDTGSPVKGGTLVVGEYGEARSMDPTKTYTSGSVGGSALAAVYDTLVRYDWTSHKWTPQLAESLETSDGGTTWTLKLRDGVKFTDGTVLDADAVLGSIEYYLKNYGYNFATWSTNVKSSKKIDDSTVEFDMNLPWQSFPGMLGHGPGMILAPAAYKDPANFQPIGAGPFKFTGYRPAEQLTVEANDDYFNGRPNLDGIKFVWPGADQAKNEALANGDIDAAFLRDPAEIAKALDAKHPGMVWVTGAGNTFGINQVEGRPGANLKVRQAINLAIDPETYYKRIGNAAAVPNKNIMPKNSPWYQDVTIAPADADAAKKLVDEAKAEGWNGKISYTHLADPVSQKAAVTMKAMLEAVGFQVTLDPQKSVTDLTQKVYIDKNFDMTAGAISIGEEDPYTGLAAPLMPTSPSNQTGYKSQKMVDALTKLAAASGPEDGKEAMTEVQQVWQDELPSINIADGNFMFASDSKLHGIQPSTQLLTLYDKAWLDK